MHLFRSTHVLLVLAVTCIAANAQRSPSETLPPIVNELYRNGLQLIREGKLAEAQDLLKRAHAQAPGSVLVSIHLAKLDALLGQANDAVALFRSVEASAPANLDNEVNLAIALATAGDLPAALVSADHAVSLDPRAAPARHIRARILAGLGRKEAAEIDFKRAVELAPHDTGVLYDYSVFCEESGEIAMQADLLTRLVQQAPENPQYHFLLGQAQKRLGNIPVARRELETAVRLDPINRTALYLLSKMLQKDEPAQAAAYGERFQSLHASEVEINSMREQGNAGVSAMAQGAWADAIRIFQETLTQCAGCVLEANLQKNLGLAQCRSGDTISGLASLHRALTLNPADADTLRAIHVAENAQVR